jgi:hypothetical protein
MAGTAVLRMVVSSDSMKNATATSQGRSRKLVADGDVGGEGAPEGMDRGIGRLDCGYSTRIGLGSTL